MPWFPDFVGAVELARQQTQAAGRADPVAQYLHALTRGDARDLEDAWQGDIVVHDPRAGEIRGHRALRHFVRDNKKWLAQRGARTERVAATVVDGRAVVELLAHLQVGDRERAWPLAVVAESADERSVVFRTYCSQWPVDGKRHIRPPILPPAGTRPGDVVGRYQDALRAGDPEATAGTFTPDGYFRGPFGPDHAHRGRTELRAFFTECFSTGGGIDQQDCCITDDGVRCAVEFNCSTWGDRDLPPQAGLGVYERGPDGLLIAARAYDDIEPPFRS
jgi:hypothetical protein